MDEQELDSLIVQLDLAKEYKKRAKSLKEQLKYELIEQELSERLCRCIKKVQSKNKTESAAIGICTKSVFSNKGLKRSSFSCKETPKLYPAKGNKYAIKKMSVRQGKGLSPREKQQSGMSVRQGKGLSPREKQQSGMSVRQGKGLSPREKQQSGMSVGQDTIPTYNDISGLKVIDLRKLAKKQGIQLTKNGKYKTKGVLIKELIEQKGGSANKKSTDNTLILLEKRINKLLNEYCMKLALQKKEIKKNIDDAVKYVKQNINSTDKRVEKITKEIAIYKFDFLDSDI